MIIHDTNNWPFRWFGFWGEFGNRQENLPSIKVFIDPIKNESYDKIKLLDYLSNGQGILATSRAAFSNIFENETKTGTVAWRTDGTRFWFDSICDYIQNFSLVIPEKWYKEIESIDFKLPKYIDIDSAVLDFQNNVMPTIN